ncbi:MAG: hypothetical protein KIT70_08420 [Anaerolineales bacterium]|nr:MAG: hypothetical protein KIT70_08420 [Anaerolineales bacterium]
MDISLTETLPRRTLDWQAFNQIPSSVWQAILNEDNITINMDGLNFVDPDGLVWLTYIFRMRKMKGVNTYLTLPSKENQISFLKYTEFDIYAQLYGVKIINELALYSDLKYTSKKHREINRLRHIDSTNVFNVTARVQSELHDQLIDELKLPGFRQESYHIVSNFLEVIIEILSNMSEYGKPSDMSEGGEGFASFVPMPSSYGGIKHSFSDLGLGFRHTMLQKPIAEKYSSDLATDKGAILLGMLYRKISSEERIVGLFPILRTICAREGKLRIRSGGALVTLDLSSPEKRQKFEEGHNNATTNWLESFCQIQQLEPIPGTHIQLEMRFPKNGASF